MLLTKENELRKNVLQRITKNNSSITHQLLEYEEELQILKDAVSTLKKLVKQ
jgi:hypothetical protein